MIASKTNNTLSRIWIYGILVIVSALVALLAVKNIKLTHDSLTYGLVSQQIISGNGIRTPNIWLDSTAVPVNGTVPMILHAPLLPILLALLGGITPNHYLAAQVLNLICHILISIFTFSLMKRLVDHDYIALLTGILVSVSYPLLTNAHHIWTEPLFIALITATIYFIAASRGDSDSRYGRYFLLAGICASAAILTRHAGLAILSVIYWEAFILIKNRRPEIKNASTIIAVILPTVTPLVYYAYSYKVAGRIQGYVDFEAENTLLSAVTGAISMTFEQFLLGPRSITLIIICIMIFIAYICLNSHARRDLSKFFHKGLDLIIIFTISYLALIIMALTKRAPVFETRFMNPLIPVLFIMSVFAIVFIWNIIKDKGFYKLSMGGVILSLGIIAFGNCYKTFLNIPEFYSKQEKLYTFTGLCTYNWIIENYERNTIITSNGAHRLSFFGGYSTVVLPNRRYTKGTRIREDMGSFLPARMLEIGSPVLALLYEKGGDMGEYLEGLLTNREDHDKFIMVHECSDGVVYQLSSLDKL